MPGLARATHAGLARLTLKTVARNSRRELGDFLRSRRAMIQPGDVGFPAGGQRRVPGLRREELAIVAGVSPDHYQRIEQGRSRPSTAVIRAIADVLRLDQDERHYLHQLASAEPSSMPRATTVPPHLRRLVDATESPAYLLNHRRDVLAWNHAAAALICDFATIPAENRNIAWLVFTDSRLRDLFQDWAATARSLASVLRYAEGDHPDDHRLTQLIARLQAASPEFRHFREVAQKCGGFKTLRHPVVGEIVLAHQSFAVNGHPGLELVMYGPRDEASADTLRVLNSWAAASI